MPLAFSISEGIAIGILVHVILLIGLGRWKQLTPLSLILAVLFLLHFIFRP
jgi:adenine/guanine/hypoxanthine permease